MVKKISGCAVLLATIMLLTSVELYAQTRIRFARGRSSATVSGTIPPKTNRYFIVGARGGQYAVVYVNNRRLQVFSDEAPKGESGGTSFETRPGDNEFELYNPTNSTVRFSMTISIR